MVVVAAVDHEAAYTWHVSVGIRAVAPLYAVTLSLSQGPGLWALGMF